MTVPSAPPPSQAVSEPSTDRRLRRMALPIIVSNATVPLLGAVDTAVVGHLPDPAFIGGVALGTVIYNYVHASLNFLRMGTTGPTAQAVGAGHGLADGPGWGEVRNILTRAMLLAGLLGLAIVLAQSLIVQAGLWALDGSQAVEAQTANYLAIRLWSAPAALAMFVAIGWFYGLEDGKTPLYLQLFANGLNIALDFLFVWGFGWGVEGVAGATVIAEYLAIALAFVLIRRRLATLPGGQGRTRVLDLARLRRMMSVNRDIFIRTLILITGLAIFMNLSAMQGDVALAANQVLYQMVMIGTYALDGFAHAAEALVGEAYGARNRERVRRATFGALRWSFGIAVGLAVLWGAGGWFGIQLLTGIEEVQARARDFLPYAVAFPLVSVVAFVLDGVFLGATQNRLMRNAMLMSFVLYLLALWLTRDWGGNDGLWLCLLVFFSLRGATLWLFWPRLLRRAEAA
ncbi:MAG: MATE family efflux transporter [Alphaproteobacteria bacterium]|nr:MATE family efflux transporter [Alphaproteobacteria bacterium]MCB9928497.1 MATE family efflux transporter [Alphaproteobacteria bacterium]